MFIGKLIPRVGTLRKHPNLMCSELQNGSQSTKTEVESLTDLTYSLALTCQWPSVSHLTFKS